ncbi:CdaR family protein [Lutibacter sp.]|uniref:CdaR family protein n=1 Tax=Lutibacter sp. TaxID=1925666 RepID=UPI0027331FAF|nr:CdaR family protein [Lutibacter sp.]MDP3313530.1 CdaR family protein [Lutibacter sp.]
MDRISKNTHISLNSRRKFKIFLLILVVTSIVWFFVELSKTYDGKITIHVNYINLPSDKLLQSKPKSEVELWIRASGLTILNYNILERTIDLKLDQLIKGKSNYYIVPNNQLTFINSQLKGNVVMLKVLTEVVKIDVGKSKTKKIPVVSRLIANFKVGYNLIENLKIEPDSIEITGPNEIIDTIHFIETKRLTINDVYENIKESIDLKNNLEKRGIKISRTQVVVIGKVDKITEGKIKIPVRFINKPQDVILKTFPKEIEIIYQTGLSNFKKITTESFDIVFDYNEYLKETQTRFLTPVIKRKSPLITTLRVEPTKIEYFIQK